jgi:hypothetical protein
LRGEPWQRARALSRRAEKRRGKEHGKEGRKRGRKRGTEKRDRPRFLSGKQAVVGKVVAIRRSLMRHYAGEARAAARKSRTRLVSSRADSLATPRQRARASKGTLRLGPAMRGNGGDSAEKHLASRSRAEAGAGRAGPKSQPPRRLRSRDISASRAVAVLTWRSTLQSTRVNTAHIRLRPRLRQR